MRKIEVKEGQRFGKLTIIKEVEPRILPCGKGRRTFLCVCDCGNIKEALLSEVLPCFMHGGEADEVVAMLGEKLNKR